MSEPAPIVDTITTTGITCAGCTADVAVTATGGTGVLTGTGTFKGLSEGAYTFTVTDENGCTGTATIVLTAPAGGLDGLQTVIGEVGKDSQFIEKKAMISQYPNLATTNATFEFSVPQSETVTLSIVNHRAELIETVFSEEVDADRIYTLTRDITGLENGIYFVYLNTADGIIK